jgi:GT2 family glycosyltransferase
MIKLAVITINHQHGVLLQKTLDSFKAILENFPVEMYLINNASDSNITAWVNRHHPKIHLIENDSPKGFAENINAIIQKHFNYDYYLLLNPDVICQPGLVSTLVNSLNEDPKIGIAGPQLLNMDGTIQPSRRRFAPFLALVIRALHIDKLFPRLSIIDKYLMNDVTFEGTTPVDWVTGAVMLIRRAALEEVGLMDERFYLYFEDEDLCCRMWQKGWKVLYVPEAQAYHEHIAAGRNKIFSKANFHHILSAFKMLIKYRGKITECYHKKHNARLNGIK